MTENSDDARGDLTAWSLGELEVMLAEQVRLLKQEKPQTPEARRAHVRSIIDLICAARQMAMAKTAKARAQSALAKAVRDMRARQPQGAQAREDRDDIPADDHDLEQRQAFVDARLAAMAGPAPEDRARGDGPGDERGGGAALGPAGA